MEVVYMGGAKISLAFLYIWDKIRDLPWKKTMKPKLLTMLEPFISIESVSATNGYVPLLNTGYIYPEYRVSKIPNIIDLWMVELLIGTHDLLRDKSVKVISRFKVIIL